MTRTLSPVAVSFSVLAGPFAWFTQFMLVYMVAEFGCRANFNNVVYFEPSGIRLFAFITTLVALIPVAFGGVWAMRQARQLNLQRENDTEHEARERFLVTLGMAFSIIFMLSIIATALPAFFVAVCDRAL